MEDVGGMNALSVKPRIRPRRPRGLAFVHATGSLSCLSWRPDLRNRMDHPSKE